MVLLVHLLSNKHPPVTLQIPLNKSGFLQHFLARAEGILGHGRFAMDTVCCADDRILRLPEVKWMTGKSRSAIYSEIKDGRFPKQSKIGDRAVGWSHASIQSYIRAKITGDKN
jgi:prophage regulatory protein